MNDATAAQGASLKGVPILVVEDDRRVAGVLARALQAWGATVQVATTAFEARAILAGFRPSVAVLDLLLPDDDGFGVMEAVRQRDATVGVIFLTGNASIESAAEAVRRGATDYLVKGGGPSVLRDSLVRALDRVARDRAVNRSARAAYDALAKVVGAPAAAERFEIISAGPFVLDERKGTITVAGQSVTLTAAPSTIFAALMRRVGEPISTGALAAAIGRCGPGDHRTVVRQHICTLRKAIEPTPRRPIYVQTVRSEGYRLVIPSEPIGSQ